MFRRVPSIGMGVGVGIWWSKNAARRNSLIMKAIVVTGGYDAQRTKTENGADDI